MKETREEKRREKVFKNNTSISFFGRRLKIHLVMLLFSHLSFSIPIIPLIYYQYGNFKNV